MTQLKRWISAVLASCLILTLLPASALASNPTESISDISGETATLTASMENDNRAPVASNVVVEDVVLGEDDSRTVYLTFDVTDTEGDTLDPSQCRVPFSISNSPADVGLLTSVEKQSDGSYTAAFSVPSDMPGGTLNVFSIWLTDQFGNGQYTNLANVTGTVPMLYQSDYTIGDITLDGSTDDLTVALSPDNVEQTVTLKAPLILADGVETAPTGSFSFAINNDLYNASRTYYGSVVQEDDQYFLSGTMSFDFSVLAGEYTLSYVLGDGKTVTFDSAPTITITKEQTDFDGPVIEDTWFTVNGERYTGNFTVKDGDTLNFYLKVTDASEIKTINAAMQSSVGQYLPIGIIPSGETGESGVYVCSISVDQMANTVWSLMGIGVSDVFFNNTSANTPHLTHFFTKTDSEGNCELSTTTQVFFNNGSGKTQYQFTADGLPTMKEIQDACGVTPPEMEGATFLGWRIQGTDGFFADDDIINVYHPMYPLTFYPVYDKIPLTVVVRHVNENGEFISNRHSLNLPIGSTYGDVLDYVNSLDLTVTHTGEAVFQQWDVLVDTDMDTVITLDTTIVYVNAKYDKFYSVLYWRYAPKNVVSATLNSVVFFEEEPAVADVVTYFTENIAPTLTHHEHLTFTEWLFQNRGTVGGVSAIAQYDEPYVGLRFSYVAPDGTTVTELCASVHDSATIAPSDALAYFNENIAPNIDTFDALGTVTWNFNFGTNSSVLLGSGGLYSLVSQYEHEAAIIQYTYTDADGNECTAAAGFVLEEGATVADARAYFESTIAPTLAHSAALGNVTWVVDDELEDSATLANLDKLSFKAEYEPASISGTCGENLTWSFDKAIGTLTISGEGEMADANYYGVVPWYRYAANIKSVVIGEGVTSIGSFAFYDCSTLSEITIPEGVTSIGDYAFHKCSALTEIVIPESITSIGDGIFYKCSALTEVKLPDTLTSIGTGAFYVCSSLTEIVIPEGVTSIGSSAFSGCAKLASVNIPDNVTFIGGSAFRGCNALADENNFVVVDHILFDYIGTISSVAIPEGVTSISDYAFYYCSSLTEITIPEGVTSIGSRAFFGCSALTSITFSGDAPTIGEYAFSNVPATVYYPYANDTWTEDVMQQYGSTLTWEAYDNSPLTGWQQIDGIWHYFNTDGESVTGWQSIGGVWYYFNTSGAMVTGWQSVGGVWYYFNPSGAMVTGWQSVGGVWYYFNPSGAMVTGWQSVGGVWYYFNPSGAMVTGWQSVGGVWYYFNPSGAMVTGWQLVGGVWYYFNPSGAMVTGWQSIGGAWYYFHSSGAMVTGWHAIGGTWYYFSPSGAMATSWQQLGGTWYYFHSSGAMATGTHVIGGTTYVFSSSGAWIA